MRGYLPLIRKGSSTRMHGLAIDTKEGLLFARDLSLEKHADCYLCFIRIDLPIPVELIDLVNSVIFFSNLKLPYSDG